MRKELLMKRVAWFTLGVCGVLACWLNASGLRAGGSKGTVVEFDDVKSVAPADWKEEKVKGFLRFMQFRLPKVKDDKDDAEVVIFKGIGGSTKDNVERWKKTFIPPKGKKLEEVAKVTEMKVGKAGVTYLDISGTYLFKARPNDPNAKVEERPNSRMLGVVFEGKDNTYHIRLVGPATTVEHYKKGFDEWLKNFK
jgi:hypothetical protein